MKKERREKEGKDSYFHGDAKLWNGKCGFGNCSEQGRTMEGVQWKTEMA